MRHQELQLNKKCLDVPILENKDILGGWKYINENTGMSFSEDENFSNILKLFLKKLNNNKFKPREWFLNNYSKSHEKLIKFLKM